MVLTAPILSVFAIPSSLCLAIEKKPKLLKCHLSYCVDSLFWNEFVLLLKLVATPLVSGNICFHERGDDPLLKMILWFCSVLICKIS